MSTFDLSNDFLAHKPVRGVKFQHNDYVKIVAGEHKGKSGSLISLESLAPEPKFILELESGFDVIVLQSELENKGA